MPRRYLRSPSRQSGNDIDEELRSTEYIGRRAGVGYCADVQSTIVVCMSDMVNISRAKSAHVIPLSDVDALEKCNICPWYVSISSITRASACTRSPQYVGTPCWSATTCSVSRVCESFSIVLTKFLYTPS
jgi:hypothetical protein